MTGVVLDASAVLALIRDEQGGSEVAAVISQAIISAVNLQEVIKELLASGLSVETAREILDGLRLDVRNHDQQSAYEAAALYLATRTYGRGLGDRSCMALGIALACPVMTADREWRNVEVDGLQLHHIR